MPKTKAQYLALSGNDPEKALDLMLKDFGDTKTALTEAESAAAKEAGTNVRARTIAKALEPLAEALKITLPEAGKRSTAAETEILGGAVQEAVGGLSKLEGSRDTWMALAGKKGLDLEAVKAAKTESERQSLIDAWANTGTAATDGELALYKFAYQNKLNPEALSLVKGLDGLELREVTVKDKDGKDVTQKVWGIPEGDSFKPALDHLNPMLGSLQLGSTEQQQKSGMGWVGGQNGGSGAGNNSPFAGVQAQRQAQAGSVSPFVFGQQQTSGGNQK